MLDEKKVKIMTRMAMYEANQGEDDLKLSGYYQRDYASLHTWYGILWFTIGYFLTVGIVIVGFLNTILKHVSLDYYIRMGIFVVGAYLVLLIINAFVIHDIFKRRHMRARQRVKKYNRDLIRLERIYRRGKK